MSKERKSGVSRKPPKEGGNCSTIRSGRRLLQIATAALLLWAAIVYVSGGIEWRIGKAVLRSRDAARVLYPAALLVLVQALVYRREVAADLDRATAWGRRHGGAIG